MRVVLSLLFSVATLVGTTGASAAEPSWGWFVALSNANRWHADTGERAVVSISKDRFSARLLNASGDDWVYELKGTTQGNKLRVLLNKNETDLEDFPLNGVRTRKLWKNAGESESAGRELIELTGAGIVVGLTREIPKRSNRTLERDARKSGARPSP
jgi:hypothetical protein